MPASGIQWQNEAYNACCNPVAKKPCHATSLQRMAIDGDGPLNKTEQGLMPDDRQHPLLPLELHEMVHQAINLYPGTNNM